MRFCSAISSGSPSFLSQPAHSNSALSRNINFLITNIMGSDFKDKVIPPEFQIYWNAHNCQSVSDSNE